MSETNAPVGDARRSGPARPTPSQGTLVLAVVALLLGAAELLGGAWMWVLTEQDTTDDPLVGLGYLLAVAVGAPGLLGVVLAAAALLLARRRTAGLTFAILAAIAVALPALGFLFLGGGALLI